MSGPLRSGANGRMDTLVASAATDVASHGIVDLLVGRSGGFRQERGRLHDLAGLAVAALRHAKITPSHLHRMLTLGIKTLDGDHRLTRDVGHDDGAGADRFAVDVNRTGAAERNAATEFRPRQTKFVA